MPSGQKNIFRNLALGASAYFLYNAFKKRARSTHYHGKVVLISGGSRGLGLVLARQLAAQGAQIALIARDAYELQRAKAQIESQYPYTQVFCVVCDTTIEAEVNETMSQVVHHFGRLDVLINNAGIISVMPFENSKIEDFEEAMKVHLWGPLFMIRAALPHMKRRNGGRIVNISSIGGKIGVPHLAPYSASKFALVGLSDSLRAELSKDKIYITTICPGLMRTGSIGHGKFRGQQAKEFSWFAISDSLPLLTINAERAAAKILEAARVGQAELIITPPAKLAAKFRAICPEICADLMALSNRFLPGPIEGSNELIEGHRLNSAMAPSFATKLSEKAAERNNEIPLRS